MPEIIRNTLYVTTQGAYLHHDHEVLKVEIEKQTRLAVPIHHLESVALFGHVMVSPGALRKCADAGIATTFLSEHGRLLARVDAPQSGNVLLRREQFRQADRPQACLAVARNCIAGKIQNARALLQRSARESDDEHDRKALDEAAASLAHSLAALPGADSIDSLRGHEGSAASAYFDVFNAMIRQQRADFRMNGRSRRPPLDRVNALLSFAYSMLLHDCVAALTAAGLDPSVGFLHTDRPGRPALALDLMEEFRPLIADRLVLALINRRQVGPDDFEQRTGGAVIMNDAARKKVIAAYQQRKQEPVRHPLLEVTVRFGRLPFLQAMLLARTIRGELEAYPALVLK
ncbi:MAG: type I-C CRISPR-associated endonuclease Cas1c [Phycisphaerae bacterium]